MSRRTLTEDERRERVRIRNLAYYYDHREEILARQRAKRRADPESTNKKRREYYSANKERILSKQRAYIAKKRSSPEWKLQERLKRKIPRSERREQIRQKYAGGSTS